MLPQWTIVGFTGHRHLKHPGKVTEGIHNALERLSALYGPLAAISSAASGADTLYLEEVIRRKLPLLVLLPFPRARFEKDFKPPEWHRVAPLLDQALRVDEGRGADTPEEAYMQTGEHTVDRADVLIAVWDGKTAEGLGGTGDVVAYAEALEKPMLWIDPDTGTIVEKNLPAPAAKTEPAALPGNLRQLVEKHLKEKDDEAGSQAPWARYLIWGVIALHLLASVAGTLAFMHSSLEAGFDSLEVLCLVAAFFLIFRHRFRHGKWMQARVEAEICRSFLATWHVPVNLSHPQKIALTGFDGTFRSLRLLRQLDHAAGRPPFEEVRHQYLKNRLEDQIAHFNQHRERAESRLKCLKLTARACTVAALFASAFLLAAKLVPLKLAEQTDSAARSVSTLLPIFSAAFVSLIVTQEYARRTERYREMVSLLEDTAGRLRAVRTWDGLSRIAAETEGELLQEIVEWHSYTRFAGEPH